MKFLIFAIAMAAAVQSQACRIETATGNSAGTVYRDDVINASGAKVGMIKGDQVYAVSSIYDSVGTVVGGVSNTAILNSNRGIIGFTSGNTIFNNLGETRGFGYNCSQEEKGAALILLLRAY